MPHHQVSPGFLAAVSKHENAMVSQSIDQVSLLGMFHGSATFHGIIDGMPF